MFDIHAFKNDKEKNHYQEIKNDLRYQFYFSWPIRLIVAAWLLCAVFFAVLFVLAKYEPMLLARVLEFLGILVSQNQSD